MGAKNHYLVRSEKGQMRTVVAQSYRGAVRAYLDKYPIRVGSTLEVKERGVGGWQAYKIG